MKIVLLLPALVLALILTVIGIPPVVATASSPFEKQAGAIREGADQTASSGLTPPAAPDRAVSGGVLRIITSVSPQVLGYIPDMDSTDCSAVFPVVERLMDASGERNATNGLEPVLVKNVDDDVAHNRIIFYLRPNIQFSDGTALDADTVIWNFRQLIDAGHLQYQSYLKQIQKRDDLTVQIDYTEYNNQLIQSWGWTAMLSRSAWDAASGGDLARGREWAKTHVVSTGPFVLKEFVSNNRMVFVKNTNYWRSGLPYLDGIEVRFIPDTATARKMMLAGEADEWDGAPANQQLEMVGQGFTRSVSWPGMPWSIWPNTADTNSPWNDIRLRQALEYALDKPALAKALGSGYYIPMTMLAPSGEWGYNSNYSARGYNPDRARQLLEEAGLADGIKTQLLISNDASSKEAGKLIKKYLDAVGIQTDLNVVDPARFYSLVWGSSPAPGLAWMWSGRDVNYLVTYMRWFSTYAFNNMAYLGHTQEQRSLDQAAIAQSGISGQKTAVGNLIKYMTDQCRVIPVYDTPSAMIVRPWVHTTRFNEGFIRWKSESAWIDKH